MNPKKRHGHKVEILIAEDSATQREQLKYLLEQHGFTVVATINGKKALEEARSHKPDLIISDIVMPELDGYGLCNAIKTDEKTKEIPVILMTTLADPNDVINGLECGADNFIRKPYEEEYLLSRIEYLLMNLELRKNQKMQVGVEISLGDQKHFITAERQQILDLLISTYEQATYLNKELSKREQDLAHSNQVLNGLYRIADGLNKASSEQEVANTVLERALELPGVQAGWITLLEGEKEHRLVASRNLPAALEQSGAMEGDCTCRRLFFSGDLDNGANILECERLAKAEGDTRGLRFHACVPLSWGGRKTGLLNLVGPDKGLFSESELHILHGVGSQVAVAFERAHLHHNLENLVEQRTSELEKEIVERKRIESEQARLVAIIEATPDFVGIADIAGNTQYTNRAGWKMIGFEPGDGAPFQTIYEAHPPWAAKLLREEGIPHAIHNGIWSGVSALLSRDGHEVPVSQVIIGHKAADGKVESLSTIARDITQQKENERKIMRLNRVYAVLSDINTMIVRTRDRQELFNEACRIAVDRGHFRMAWIGLIGSNGLDIIPVSQAGVVDGYLDQITLTIKENVPDSCVMVGRAFRENIPIVCNDIATDPQMARWREDALKRDYRSLVVLPLHEEEKTVGLLLLYAAESNYFDQDEMILLSEVAGDISFALDHLEKVERLNYLAYYDEITGLPNRTLFFDRLNQFLYLSGESSTHTAVMVINLERFLQINETLGRHTGDSLIKMFTERLHSAWHDSNLLARISADSFAVAMKYVGRGENVVKYFEKIIQAMAQPIIIGDSEFHLSIRAGISSYPTDGKDADALVRNANAALKKALLSGDKYLFYAPEFNAQLTKKLTLENKLSRALDNEHFVLHYQPKVSVRDGRIVGLEALIRWNDPEGGMVAPGMFIPLLEETGMILEVGRWVLKKAMSDTIRWHELGLKPPRVAVNVSPMQLRQKNFVETVESSLNDSAAARYLELEITESLIMQDTEGNIQKLNAIREMGATVSIDDFGTGYSSLSYITKLPINTLKIDRAFIINLTTNPDDLSIVSAIISLAHSLDFKVVAEGVETMEQARMLRLLKCDEIQGYLFSPAVSMDQIGSFLEENKFLLFQQ
jgi:diguanylate cyclase (GGDEF)-like protein/PAS domain S-box-containing protein